jgi:far upstream element-binding protein
MVAEETTDLPQVTINGQSGAHVELQRNPGPNANEKVFVVRGNPQQVQQAISMIAEKAGVPVVSFFIQ